MYINRGLMLSLVFLMTMNNRQHIIQHNLHYYMCNEKALRETQILRAGCSKAEPKIFAPPQTTFSGAQDGQNLISWRWSLPLPRNPVW